MSSVGLVIARMNTPVPRHIAWAHLVDPELRRSWWTELQLDATLGGAVSERWNASEGEGEGAGAGTNASADVSSRDAAGKVDVMVDGHALGFRWRDRSDAYETEVLITLRSNDAGTGITVTETGFGRFLDGRNRAADAQQGWIDLLTEYVDTLSRVQFDPADVARQASLAAQPVPADSAPLESGSAPEPSSITSEIDVIPPVVEAEVEDEATDEPEELEVEAERELAELVAEVAVADTGTLDTETLDTETLQDALDADALVVDALVVEAEPEAVEIEVENEVNPEDPDFDSLIRGH